MKSLRDASDVDTTTLVRRVAAVLGVVALGVVIANAIAGSAGIRIFAVVFEALVLLVIRTSLQQRSKRRTSVTSIDPNAGFAQYRHFVAALRAATGTLSDFDRSMRPEFLRLYGQTLMARYGVSLTRDRPRARELMDDAAWLLDDARGSRRAVTTHDIDRLVSKLEELAT